MYNGVVSRTSPRTGYSDDRHHLGVLIGLLLPPGCFTSWMKFTCHYKIAFKCCSSRNCSWVQTLGGFFLQNDDLLHLIDGIFVSKMHLLFFSCQVTIKIFFGSIYFVVGVWLLISLLRIFHFFEKFQKFIQKFFL